MSSSNRLIAEASSTLADYTSPALLIPYLRRNDAAGVIQELSAALHREARIPDLLEFYHAALNREYLCSTAIGPGWALPHAPSKSLDRPWFALGRSEKPMQWSAQIREKVQLVFLLAVPQTNAGTYLTLVAGLARLSKDGELIGRLLNAHDSFEMFEVLRQVKVRPNPTSAVLFNGSTR